MCVLNIFLPAQGRRKVKKSVLIGIGLASCVVFGSWGAGNKEAAPAPTATPVAAQAVEKLSGKVIVYCPSPAKLADQIAAGFEAKTGVKVEMFQGTTGQITARLETEKANPVADVVILASWSDGMSLKDLALSYAPKNAEKMVPGWIDGDKKLIGYSASALGVIYNTTKYSTLSADWPELADPQYRDDLCIPDPKSSGSCKDFLAGFMTAYGEQGWDLCRALAKNGMVIPGANKASLDAVVTGSKGILVAGVDYNAYAYMAKGEPLGIYYPKTGTVINPRPAMILKTSANVANAKAFMDYLLSDEAQALVYKAYLLPGRGDVVADNRANVADIPQIPTDWDAMMASAKDTTAKFSALFVK